MADIFAKDTDNNVAESQQYVQAASVATSSKLMMDAYGKHYNTIEDLVRARSKQMASLYESIDGLIVSGLITFKKRQLRNYFFFL